MRNPIILITILLLMASCSHKSIILDVQNLPVSINHDIKTPFPEKPIEKPISIIQYQGVTKRSNTLEKSESQFAQSLKVENLPHSRLHLEIQTRLYKAQFEKNGKQTKVDGIKFFKNSKLSLLVNCNTQSVIEKNGFQDVLDKINKKSSSSEEKDKFTEGLSNLVKQAPDRCKKTLGPFTIQNFVGKKPGSTWIEAIPIEGFENSKFYAQFIGWHNEDGKMFAVLAGKAKAVSENNIATPPTVASFETTSFFLVSPNWREIRLSATTYIRITTPGQPDFSGTIQIETTSLQQN